MTAWHAADDAGRDLFAVLGLPWGADADAVRAAWRTTARQTHPDHGGDAEAFRAAQHARWVLSDEARRAAYLLAHDRLAGSGSGHASAGDQVADEDDFFRGGPIDADDEYFDDGGWPPRGASDGARDDATFFDDGDEADGGDEEPDPLSSDDDDDDDEDGDDGDPFAWVDDWMSSDVGGSGGLFDDVDPLGQRAFGGGGRSGRTGNRFSHQRPPPPRPRYRCASCFRHALLGIDRCWAHASDDELAAATRLAGSGRCPVLNQRNRPCGAPPLGLTAPFCIHHALDYRAPRPSGPTGSAGRSAGARTSGTDSTSDGGRTGGRPRSARDQAAGSTRGRTGRVGGSGSATSGRPRTATPRATTGRPRTTTRPRATTSRVPTSRPTAMPAQATSAASGGAMAGCLALLGLVGAIGAVLFLAGFLLEAVPGTSTVSALFQALIGLWVVRLLVRRHSRRRRRRR